MIHPMDKPRIDVTVAEVVLALGLALFFCWLFVASSGSAYDEYQREYQRNGVVTTEGQR